MNLYSNMRSSRRSFLNTAIAASAGALLAAPDSPDDSPTPEELAAMDGVVTGFMRAHEVPGMSVAVARQAVLVHQKAYGIAEIVP